MSTRFVAALGSLVLALAPILTAHAQEAPKERARSTAFSDAEIFLAEAVAGAGAYYVGSGAGFVGADAAGLLDIHLCFAANGAKCPEQNHAPKLIGAAAVIFGTAALASNAAIYLVEQTNDPEPAFWWPLAAGLAASAGSIGVTYALARGDAGLDAIEPGLVVCFIAAVAAELITMRALRD